ncbi:MAG: pyridoxal phosphate-dependent aminotransferase [Gammaproteobacteria bacterium]|nr:pyridoxal phosphate-dependent aminotransferase [Gammaproteobacteria bacterium]MYE52349.1 pyridoxal phosphate-dependent aminotransferase [Gammaproteobacteria bacterium]
MKALFIRVGVEIQRASGPESATPPNGWIPLALAQQPAPCSFESKLPEVGTTIFTVMSAMAAEEGALNLSQGFPDFDGPPELLERVQHYLTHGYNQYPPMAGVQSLREAVAGKVLDLYGLPADPETQITVTSGATEALFCAITAVVRPGDEVILFDPAYDSYEPAVRLSGGVARHIALEPPDYDVDWDQVRRAITPRTRLVIFNTPHNPTGTVWSRTDLRCLEALALEHGFHVLSDEVYEHIIFDGQAHQSVCRFPDLWQRSFVVSSFGKTYHTTGWKIGYCVAPEDLTAEFRKIHQFVTFTSNTPVQHGLADFLNAHPEHHLELGAFYQRKRDLFCALLEGSRFSLKPSSGTYFQLLGYEGISNERDSELAVRLTREAKIASIPVSIFYADGADHKMLRFCFCKDDRTLRQGAEILLKV